MQTLLQKETLLFEATSKQNTDWDFSAALVDYFDFISDEGTPLLDHISKDILERTAQEKVLTQQWTSLLEDMQETYTKLELLISKLKYQDDAVVQDSMRDYHSLLNQMTHTGGHMYDSIVMECGDVLRRLEVLGHKQEIAEFIAISARKKHSFSLQDIALYHRLESHKAETATFLQRDQLSLAGAFTRLVTAYGKLKHAPEKPVSLASHRTDLERIHTSIVLQQHESEPKSGHIFWVEGNDIYHHEIGKLTYNLRGDKIPKYITLFKNIIAYFPAGKLKMRITAFERALPEQERVGATYRANLGMSAKSFQTFLRNNGVKNVHPAAKAPLIEVTDEYITFRNNL